MKLKCPDCDIQLKGRQIQVESNEAICPRCGATHAISQLVGVGAHRGGTGSIEDTFPESFDILRPPLGVNYENRGRGWCIRADVRSWSSWIMIPVFLLWNGGTIAVVYGAQVVRGEFDLFQSFVGIPFLLVGIVIGVFTLVALFGSTVILSDERDEDAGSVRVGFGPFSLTKRFRWSEVREVLETDSGGEMNGRPIMQITLKRDEADVNFGTLLADHRRRYVLCALRQLTSSRSK